MQYVITKLIIDGSYVPDSSQSIYFFKTINEAQEYMLNESRRIYIDLIESEDIINNMDDDDSISGKNIGRDWLKDVKNKNVKDMTLINANYPEMVYIYSYDKKNMCCSVIGNRNHENSYDACEWKIHKIPNN